jgi:hypothetical protein
MKNILKNRWALSTVVTTLIILVVSVLLAGVVTYFAINVTSTRVQEESLHLTKQHIWYNVTDSSAQAAIMIINTGGRDVVFDKVTCRGQESDWADVLYATTTSAISADLPYNLTLGDGDTMTLDSVTLTFTAGSTMDLTLKSGETMVIYINNPDSVSQNDIGLTVALTVFSSQAMYYKETNVEAA